MYSSVPQGRETRCDVMLLYTKDIKSRYTGNGAPTPIGPNFGPIYKNRSIVLKFAQFAISFK